MAKVQIASKPMGLSDDYEGRSDAETLRRAEEIRSDKGRHERARKHLQHQIRHVGRALGRSRPKDEARKGGRNGRYDADNVVRREDMK